MGYYWKTGIWSRNVSKMDRNHTGLLGTNLYTPGKMLQEKQKKNK